MLRVGPTSLAMLCFRASRGLVFFLRGGGGGRGGGGTNQEMGGFNLLLAAREAFVWKFNLNIFYFIVCFCCFRFFFWGGWGGGWGEGFKGHFFILSRDPSYERWLKRMGSELS